jgi:hypothetical protein
MQRLEDELPQHVLSIGMSSRFAPSGNACMIVFSSLFRGPTSPHRDVLLLK